MPLLAQTEWHFGCSPDTPITHPWDHDWVMLNAHRGIGRLQFVDEVEHVLRDSDPKVLARESPDAIFNGLHAAVLSVADGHFRKRLGKLRNKSQATLSAGVGRFKARALL